MATFNNPNSVWTNPVELHFGHVPYLDLPLHLFTRPLDCVVYTPVMHAAKSNSYMDHRFKPDRTLC